MAESSKRAHGKYESVIGLEIHAELATRSKMFCASKNDPEEKRPNTNVCPVCLGHPGTLPVANEEAIRKVVLVGIALGGNIAEVSQFDRKHYFYPDLPKGYQISQYKHPIVSGGEVSLFSGKRVLITRVHLEEDTANLVHDKSGSTLIDFNRAGIPLMELVTEPDLRTAAEARETAEELQLIFQYVGASRARMQFGEMRVEANVSLRKKGDKVFGTKVELKNINSFRAVERAIEYEIKRQEGVLDSGVKVEQETRGWDEIKGRTVLQRKKESAEDYRYFPEPDLPPIELGDLKATLERALPELPRQKRERLDSEYGLDKEAREIFVRHNILSDFYEETASELREWISSSGGTVKPKQIFTLVRNYMLTDLKRALDKSGRTIGDMKIDPENFAELIKLVSDKKVSSRVAKDLLRHMVEDGGDPHEIVKDKEMFQVDDESELESAAILVLQENTDAVSQYKNGKTGVIEYLVGQAMQKMRGRGNPEVIRELLVKELDKQEY